MTTTRTENAALINTMNANGWDRSYVVRMIDEVPGFAARWLRYYGLA
ncbi:MAG: hypothetical protein ACRD0W_20550 [Acidimicrobiales bacterium]